MRKRIMNLMFVLFFVSCVNVGAQDSDGKSNREIVDNTYEKLPQLMEALEYINKNYVDEEKLKDNNLLYGAIKGMVATLDPHSHFMDPSEYKELQSETSGKYSGVGIEITIRNDILTVVSPFEKSPAWYKGIRAGDRILKINGVSTKNITTNEAAKKIRGPKGTKVVLTILHESSEKSEDVELIRDDIKIQSIWSYIIQDNIGYIKLRSFMESSGRDLEKALLSFEKEKIKGIIFDLRNNPGGLLDVSVDIADKFVQPGRLIVYTQGRIKGQNRKYYASRGNTFMKTVPLLLLVNKGSASASEIVSGAIQDNKRGVLIGTQTFGKGSVQSIYTLKDKSGLRLTSAYYYTPSGKKIHEKGITPDVIVEEKEPSDVYWKLKYYEYFIDYAKQYIKDNTADNKETKIDDEMVDDKLIDNFIKYVRGKGFVISDVEMALNKDFVKKTLKIEIIRLLKGEETADKSTTEEDEVVRRAIDLLKASELIQNTKAVEE